MEREGYRLLADFEEEHWWYRGRRALVAALLGALPLPPRPRLLEVGAGTGGNLALLARFGTALGVEPAAEAAALGRARWAGRVARARAAPLPFPDATFDVVAALDVLEHLHDELEALDEARRVLRPGGHLILYVPAYRFLWGHEDVVSQHRRRYRAAELRRLLEGAGLEVRHLGYATTLLFPLVAAVKLGKRLFLRGEVRPDVGSIPPWPVNDALAALVEAEAALAATVPLPFGASVVALAARP